MFPYFFVICQKVPLDFCKTLSHAYIMLGRPRMLSRGTEQALRHALTKGVCALTVRNAAAALRALDAFKGDLAKWQWLLEPPRPYGGQHAPRKAVLYALGRVRIKGWGSKQELELIVRRDLLVSLKERKSKKELERLEQLWRAQEKLERLGQLEQIAIRTFADTLCARRPSTREAVKIVASWNRRLRANVRELRRRADIPHALVDLKMKDITDAIDDACAKPAPNDKVTNSMLSTNYTHTRARVELNSKVP
jgi:hypothetical protein